VGVAAAAAVRLNPRCILRNPHPVENLKQS
jgi:hypothetical protein